MPHGGDGGEREALLAELASNAVRLAGADQDLSGLPAAPAWANAGSVTPRVSSDALNVARVGRAAGPRSTSRRRTARHFRWEEGDRHGDPPRVSERASSVSSIDESDEISAGR
jgi:hypothetical protein